VLGFSSLTSKLPQSDSGRVVCLDDPEVTSACRLGNAERAPEFQHAPDDLAYVIYTSGSTGKPKGVEVPYRALLSHNFAVTAEFGLTPQDAVLQFTPLSFDISIEEILPSWLAGARVVLRNKEVLGSISKFLSFIEREQITVLNLPTAFFHALTEALSDRKLSPSVRLVIIGGETVSPDYWDLWHERVASSVQLINAYGLTETTITSTVFVSDRKRGRTGIPIGRPIANTTAHILDEQLRPVPSGVTGELFIGGEGLASGYCNSPELTSERFITIDGGSGPERVYKTGDHARFTAERQIEFLGRVDDMVKLRGFRIQLSEIEAALCRHPAINQAIVQSAAYGDREPRLVAYFMAAKGREVTAGQLIKFLQQTLPEYMIPSAFVRLEAFPLTPSGKVDRKSLPLPGTARPALSEAFVAPRTALEEKIAGVWREVLHLDEVGVNDNFFDLGGHSLHAMQVMGRLRDLLSVELPVSDLFEAPTVAGLANAIEANASQPAAHTAPVLPAERREPPPLSFAQQRLWFLHQLEPEAPLYNLPQAIHLTGRLNLGALQRSFQEILVRHEVLRTTYQLYQGQPVQVIAPAAQVAVPLVDLSPSASEVQQRRLRECIADEARKPFALERDLMLRVTLIRLAPEEHVLLVTTHHIAADGWSIEVLWQEFASLYSSFLRASAPALPPPRIQYADYAIWQRNWLQGDLMEKQLNYWREQLKGAPALLELPLDHSRPAIQSYRGARHSVEFPAPLIEQLKVLGQSEGCTLFMTLLAGFQTVLSRYSGCEDLVVGTVMANRNRPELEGVIGCFANTLVLRTSFAGNPTFRELLQRTRKTTLEAYAHQDLPFERLVEELQPARDRSYHPVFQVMLVLQNVPVAFQGIPGLEVAPSDTDNGMSKFDLLLSLTETPAGLTGFVEYSTELFQPQTIERFIGHLSTLLTDAVARPQSQVSRLELLSERERRQLTEEWNSRQIPLPKGDCIHQWFEKHAAKTPAKVALAWKDQQITYGELDARATQLARQLADLNVGRETLVGICSNRTPEMVIAILAVLKTGAAYVPMDPAYPRDRLQFILEDAKAPIVLTESSLKSLVENASTHAICLDQGADFSPLAPPTAVAAPKRTEARAPAEGSSSQLAYVMFTSGSTGRPKGVAIEHRSVIALAAWAKTVFTPEELEGVLAATSICFDLSVFEILVPLGLGGKIILADNALQLPQLPAREEVRLINTVPSAITELLRMNGVPESVQTINLAGEPLAQSLVEKLYQLPQVRNVYDLYGPTEATVYSTFTRRSAGGQNNIGRPLPNEQAYILDQHQQPVPIGVSGELFIGGAGLARGYWNQPELTADRFVADPFHPGSGQRLYRTGDRVRYFADGAIEYLGRIDHQVKIRGFRIELGEVEAQLRKHPAVAETIVVADQDHSGDKRLVAYVVLKSAAEPAELRDFLKQTLPEYMVPSLFVALDALPLTPNGKVDRKALPKPEAQTRTTGGADDEPRTDAEILLAEIWREVLGVERVGIHDNFFDLGGHSLMITRVLSRLREALQVELPMKAMFEAPAIAGFAVLVENALVEQINTLTDEEVQKLDQIMENSEPK
jgi:amino acid adenylation domain-containing protein